MKKKKILIISILVIIFIVISIIAICIYQKNIFYSYESKVDKVINYEAKHNEVINSWIQVQGTNIDYPIIQNSLDFDVNEHIDFDFVWTENTDVNISHREVIVGHNYLNVSSNPLIINENHSRFEQLMSFLYPEFLEENKYITFTKDGEDYVYKIFSIGFFKDRDIEYYENYNVESINEYLDETIENSVFDFDVDVNENDKILSLVTCTRMFGIYDDRSLKIDAKLVEKGENMNNYEFNKNDNYEEIENAMKGGNGNDL